MLPVLTLIAALAARHPIHSSSAAVSFPAGTGRAAIVLRVFAEDFAADRAGAPVEQYLATRFRLLDRRGVVAPLRLEDQASDGTVLVLTLSAPAADGLAGGKIWHGVLAGKFPDQVNMVRVQRDGNSASLLFMAGDGAKPLP